jgi:hypothetical protein
MKSSIILKSLVAILIVGFFPKISLASGGKPNMVFREILMNSIPDTSLPAPKQTVVDTKDKKEVKTIDKKEVKAIKVLPKTHRQPIPVPVKVKVKVPKVKVIKHVVKPVIKILH